MDKIRTDSINDTITAQNNYNGIFIGNDSYTNSWSTYDSSKSSQIRGIVNELVDTIQNRNIAKQAFISIMLKVLDDSINCNVIKELCECLTENQISKETFMYIVMNFVNDNQYKVFFNNQFPNTSITTTTIQPLNNKSDKEKQENHWYDVYNSDITNLSNDYANALANCLTSKEFSDIYTYYGSTYSDKADNCAYTCKE